MPLRSSHPHHLFGNDAILKHHCVLASSLNVLISLMGSLRSIPTSRAFFVVMPFLFLGGKWTQIYCTHQRHTCKGEPTHRPSCQLVNHSYGSSIRSIRSSSNGRLVGKYIPVTVQTSTSMYDVYTLNVGQKTRFSPGGQITSLNLRVLRIVFIYLLFIFFVFLLPGASGINFLRLFVIAVIIRTFVSCPLSSLLVCLSVLSMW